MEAPPPGRTRRGADSVILLELGRLVWSGPRHSLQDQQLAAIFLVSATEVASPDETLTKP